MTKRLERHKHAPERILGPFRFTACVATPPARCFPQSHNGDVYIEVCSCGARRSHANKGWNHERSEWMKKIP